jgi:hypothetical protein
MSLHLHHVTAEDADRDRRRTPLDLTNDAIEQQRQRNIVQQSLQIDRLEAGHDAGLAARGALLDRAIRRIVAGRQ